MNLRQQLRFAARQLAREWKAGALTVLLLALVVAIASHTAISHFTSRISATMADSANDVIGGDLVLTSGRPVDAALLERAAVAGLRQAHAVQFPSVISAGDGDVGNGADAGDGAGGISRHPRSLLSGGGDGDGDGDGNGDSDGDVGDGDGDGDSDGDGDADAKLYGDMAAGGFYDFTRTASSDPEMWRDICMTNRENILHQLMLFIDRVQSFVMLLGANDIEGLERLFEAARNTRARVGDRRKRADKPSKPPES